MFCVALAAFIAVALAAPVAEKHVVQTRVGTFVAQNCGSSSAPLQLNSLSITPDPIVTPGNITVSGSITLSAAQSSPIKLTLDLEKQVGVWVKIPCIDNIGSCTYDDICVLLEKIPLVNGQCPASFQKYNLPCRCPIPANTWSINDLSVYISEAIPSALQGNYKAQLTFNDAAGTETGCILIEVTAD